jgi:aryl-alcohol dehydrogenase-like predicted oxidoreductase
MADEALTLAGSEVAIPPMGVGAWAWGDRSTWGMGGYDSSLTVDTIAEAWEASIDAGVTLFDTAEVYGKGESERIIGKLLAGDPERAGKVQIATKFMPAPQKLRLRSALLNALRASLERLGLDKVALYQIHGPISLRGHAAMAEALAAAHQEGLVEAVGVSNYSAQETRKIDAELRKRGLRLASNQVELSLLRTSPVRHGLLETCKELGVVALAYSPLAQGRLTGKYSATNAPQGRRNFGNYSWEKVDPLLAELRRLGEQHHRTPAQVALNWVMAKGAVPIPGAKNRHQAEQNAGALGWQLGAADIAALDDLSQPGAVGIQSRLWQHG